METSSPARSFAKNLLLATRIQSLESNLNLDQLSRMNEIAIEKYSSMISQVADIEESYSNILSEYELDNELYDEIKSFRLAIDKIDSSVSLLEEMTQRLESKLSLLQ